MTWIESIARLHSGIDLEPHEVSSIMQTILEGRAEVSDIKEFLLALKKKGALETRRFRTAKNRHLL